MKQQATGFVVVGRLLCGTFRDMLERWKWQGANIEWREGKGWLDRRFDLRGDADVLRTIQRWIDEVNRDAA